MSNTLLHILRVLSCAPHAQRHRMPESSWLRPKGAKAVEPTPNHPCSAVGNVAVRQLSAFQAVESGGNHALPNGTRAVYNYFRWKIAHR
jgi:hypothetical protein